MFLLEYILIKMTILPQVIQFKKKIDKKYEGNIRNHVLIIIRVNILVIRTDV
jgi:hypothetical protein